MRLIRSAASVLLIASATSSVVAQTSPQQVTAPAERAQWAAALSEFERELIRLYVFEDVARQTVRKIEAQRRTLLASANPKAFASAVAKVLKDSTKDVHLAFFYDPEWAARASAPAAPATEAEFDAEKNGGFNKFEILPGNIAYWRIDEMVTPTDGPAGDKAVAAMRLAADSDAVIIDLRRNPGGDGKMNQLLSTYFFGESDAKMLVTNTNRSEGKTYQEWTLPFVPGKRLTSTPLYFLIGPNTGSAAEGLAYNLRALGRAKTVGTKSAGGAHSGDLKVHPGGFLSFIPSGRVLNPITGSNWERVGVPIDVAADVQLAPAAALAQVWAEKAKSAAQGSQEADRAAWYLNYYQSVAQPPAALTNTPELAGNYGEDREVRALGNSLYLGRTGQPAQLLRPLKDGSFMLESADYYGPASSRWVFKRDASGKVVALEQQLRTDRFNVVKFEHARR